MRSIRLYVLFVGIAALVAVVVLSVVAGAWSMKDLTAAAFFAGFGVLAEALQYQVSRGRSGTIGFLPFLSIAMIAPNGATVASVCVAMMLGELIVRREFLKAQFNIGQQVFAVTLGVLAYVALGGKSIDGGPVRIVPVAALFIVYMLAHKAVVAYVLSLANRTAYSRELTRAFKGSLVNDVLALPLVLVIALAYARFGPWWTGFMAFPMLLVRQLYKAVFDLERINIELLHVMVGAIEAHDTYTSGHSQRVARYSRVIARVLGLSSRQVEEIGTAALLHDVGKIHEEFAPILRQPRKLTDAEYEIMKTHSAKGATLVAKVSHFKSIVPAVRGHHEAWSGRGYPDGLAGDAIPLGARIITIADTIDAMTTVRPYRPPRSMEEVHAELKRVAGTQFDPRICREILIPENWRDLRLEVTIASGEFPVESGSPVPEEHPAGRHSQQLPTSST